MRHQYFFVKEQFGRTAPAVHQLWFSPGPWGSVYHHYFFLGPGSIRFVLRVPRP